MWASHAGKEPMMNQRKKEFLPEQTGLTESGPGE